MIKKTELKYWQSGYSVRGSKRRFLAFKISKIGFLLFNFKPYLDIYILI